MVSNGNHPLNHPHYDDLILEEYVLGQLLPDEDAQIREHIATCPLCRARVAEIRAVCQDITVRLRHDLDNAEAGPKLSFDYIASEWKQPRRATLAFRLQQLAPSTSTLLLLVLFVTAFLLLIPSSNTAALRNLDIAEDYQGPPAVIAAGTNSGLVVVRFEANAATVVAHLPFVNKSRNLQLSPDAEWLAFQEGSILHILQTRENGLHAQITLTETADWAWSPDSQTLAYTDGAGQLVSFSVIDQTNTVIVPAHEYAWGPPVWTEDGNQIAYAVAQPLPTTTDGPYTRQGIWRVNPATGYRAEVARTPHPEDTLLVPAGWADNNSVMLAWNVRADVEGSTTSLYKVDIDAHHIDPILGSSLAQGNRLAWPISSEHTALVMFHHRLYTLNLDSTSRRFAPEQIPWPTTLDWAPNGAWMAYAASNMAAGEGLYLFAPEEGKLREITLPDGATEKAAFWAGPEYLFVLRQPEGRNATEVWLVPLTTNDPPQRIINNLRMPQASPYTGWRWQDVLNTQVVVSH